MPRKAERSDGDGVRIATRASELALRQARIVQQALERQGVTAELVTFKTVGDKRLDEPLSGIGAKGLFTAELERALTRGTVACAVHSLKDLPTETPEGLAVGAVLPREDPRDVLVLNPITEATTLDDIPRGSRIGTSSLRRRAQLRAARQDLEVVDLRGNVPTRLRKVAEGSVHGAVLAGAGLLRLDAVQRITAWLQPPEWLPAAGQGAIAVQIRDDDARMRELTAGMDDARTRRDVVAERAFLAALEGGCQVPIGALVTEEQGAAVLHGMIAHPSGRRVVRGSRPLDPEDPERTGRELASELYQRGGEEILSELRGLERVPSPQPE